MTEIEVDVLNSVTQENENQWNNVVEQSDLGGLFHRYEWLRTCEEALDVDPYHVVVRKGNNPVAVFPNFERGISVERYGKWSEAAPVRRLVSTEPGVGGPVVMVDEEACLDRMFDVLDDVGSMGVLYHTVRTGELGYTRYGEHFLEKGYEPTVVDCRPQLDLTTDWETLREEMHKSRRQGLNRADDAGVEVREVDLDTEELRSTYEGYVANMERIDVDPFPFAFFERLHSLFEDRVAVFVAERDGEELGRYLHLLDEERSALTYYFAAIPDAEALDVHASEALHGAAIQWGQDRGYDVYDFGATGADFTDGVFKFKHRFGAETVPSLAWQRGHSLLGWPGYKLARSLYRRAKG